MPRPRRTVVVPVVDGGAGEGPSARRRRPRVGSSVSSSMSQASSFGSWRRPPGRARVGWRPRSTASSALSRRTLAPLRATLPHRRRAGSTAGAGAGAVRPRAGTDRPVPGRSVPGRSVRDRSVRDRSVGRRLVGGRSEVERATGGRPVDGRPVGGPARDGRSAVGRASGGRRSDEADRAGGRRSDEADRAGGRRSDEADRAGGRRSDEADRAGGRLPVARLLVARPVGAALVGGRRSAGEVRGGGRPAVERLVGGRRRGGRSGRSLEGVTASGRSR